MTPLPLRKLRPSQYRKIVEASPHLLRPLTPAEIELKNGPEQNKEGLPLLDDLIASGRWVTSAEAARIINRSTNNLGRLARRGEIVRKKCLSRRRADGFLFASSAWNRASCEAFAVQQKEKKNNG